MATVKRLVVYLLFFLFIYSVQGFTESFPATAFNQTCNIVPATGFTRANFLQNGTQIQLDNVYYCLRNSSWDGHVQWSNATNTFNTKNSMQIRRSSSSVVGGTQIRLVTFLSEPQIISTGTAFNYYSYQGSASPRGWLQLYDSNYDVFISLPINADSSFCQATYGSSVPNCCNISAELMSNIATDGERTYAFAIDNACGKNIIGRTVYAVGFSSVYNDLSQPTIEMRVDDIDINFTSNELPYLNVSGNLSQCFNSSHVSENIPVDLSYTSFDTEGDTIYYALSSEYNSSFIQNSFDSVSILNTRKCTGNYWLSTFLFGIFNFLLNCDQEGKIKVDIGNLPSYVTYNDNCRILTDYNMSENYITPSYQYDNSVVKMLVQNSNCNRYPEVYLDARTDLGYLESFTYIVDHYFINHVNMTFNITYYRILGDTPINQIKFIQNDSTTLQVYSLNSTSEKYLGKLTLSGDLREFVEVQMYYDSSLNQIQVNLTNGANNFYGTNEGYSDNSGLVSYIGTKISNTDYLGNLETSGSIYGGKKLSPVWSTSMPSTVNIYSSEPQYLTVYVTDEAHKDFGYFNYERIYLAPELCTPYSNNNLKNNPIITPLRSVFSPFLVASGLAEEVYALSWLVWLIIFILIFLFTINFGLAFIFSSFSMLLLSMIGFGDVLHIITYTVLFSLSLMPYIVSMLFPINRGGGQA